MAAPVYLYTGPEAGERNDAVEAVRQNLQKKFGSSDDFTYYGGDVRIPDVVAQLRTDSLFTPASFIVIRNAEVIKSKEDIELLGQWISNPSENNVLVFTSDEISVDPKLSKLIPKENTKIFWEMDESRKSSWVNNFFRKNGYYIEPDAVELILELIENNTEELKSECSRFLLCFPKDHAITSSDVDQILSHNREENSFTLFDAMTDIDSAPQKRLENSLAILQKILLTKNNNSVMLLAGLVSCFRKLSLWKTLHSAGSYPEESTLKSNGFTSKKARNQYARASKVWSSGQCMAIISLISKTDMEMRSLGTVFSQTQLELLLYQIIIKKGAYCSDYE